MKNVAIVLAGGRGKRMNSNVQKQYLLIHEKPVLYYSLNTFQESFVDEIVLVVPKGEEEYCKREIVEKYDFTKVKHIVCGGKERYHSVYQGLLAIDECDYVFIHDGARPFLTQEILQRVYDAVQEEKACVVGMPVKDTIKITDENEYATETPNREQVWMVQTPQTFSFTLIKEAYTCFLKQEEELLQKQIKITDDAMVVETFTEHKVKLVKGSYQNIKITTPEDLDIANLFSK